MSSIDNLLIIIRWDSIEIDAVRSSSKKPIALWFCLPSMISPRPSTRLTAATSPGKKHYCGCSQYCKGRRTEVHRSTYQRHAPVRRADLEKSFARYRREKSSLSAEPSLEGGSTNRASESSESESGTQERMDTHWQVRHTESTDSDQRSLDGEIDMMATPTPVCCHLDIFFIFIEIK